MRMRCTLNLDGRIFEPALEEVRIRDADALYPQPTLMVVPP